MDNDKPNMNGVGLLFRLYNRLISIQMANRSRLIAFGLRSKGATVGKGLYCVGRVTVSVSPGSKLILGDLVRLGDGVKLDVLSGGTLILSNNVRVEDNVILRTAGDLIINQFAFLNTGTIVHCDGNVSIGEYSLLAPYTFISDFNHGTQLCGMPIQAQPNTLPQPVWLGRDVWIGTKATVLPGVSIGEGAVIAANAVVTKNALPYSIMAGVPARLLRMRTETPASDDAGSHQNSSENDG